MPGLGLWLALAGGCYSGAAVDEGDAEATRGEASAGSEGGDASDESGALWGDEQGGEPPSPRGLDAGNRPPEIVDPGPQSVAEDESSAENFAYRILSSFAAR